MGRNAVVSLLALALVPLLYSSCKPKRVVAYVECKGSATGINCTVTHKEGKVGANVCWDVEIECKGDVEIKGHACQDVGVGGKSSKMIPKSELANWSKCKQATSFKVTNLKVKPK